MHARASSYVWSTATLYRSPQFMICELALRMLSVAGSAVPASAAPSSFG
jgi:hypothetical protein